MTMLSPQSEGKPARRPTGVVGDFIDALGGNTAVATKTGAPAGRVRAWRFRNVLPRSAWPEIMEAYPTVTLDQLKGLEARQ